MAQQFLLPSQVPADEETARKVVRRFVQQAAGVLNALLRSGAIAPVEGGFEVAGAGGASSVLAGRVLGPSGSWGRVG